MARRKTHAEFVAEVEALVGDEYTVLSEYVNGSTKLTLKHNICSHVYDIKPYAFLQGRRCPKCNRTKRIKSTEKFKHEVFDLTGNEYSVLGEYTNNSSKIKMKHNTCSHTYEVRPMDFLHGNRCPKCRYINVSQKLSKTQEEFEQEVFSVAGNEYSVLGEYVNNGTKIKIRHNTCLHSYDVTPRAFLIGRRCPKCNDSKGEHQIHTILTSLGVKFSREFSTDNCRDVRPLRFDFAVFNNDEELACLIEYDGKQHYQPVERFGGVKLFEIRKKHDAIKEKYCRDTSIPFLRIPYWDFDNIDEIVTNKLQELDAIIEKVDAS